MPRGLIAMADSFPDATRVSHDHFIPDVPSLSRRPDPSVVMVPSSSQLNFQARDFFGNASRDVDFSSARGATAGGARRGPSRLLPGSAQDNALSNLSALHQAPKPNRVQLDKGDFFVSAAAAQTTKDGSRELFADFLGARRPSHRDVEDDLGGEATSDPGVTHAAGRVISEAPPTLLPTVGTAATRSFLGNLPGGLVFSRPVPARLQQLLLGEVTLSAVLAAPFLPRLCRSMLSDRPPGQPTVPWAAEAAKYYPAVLPCAVLYTALNMTAASAVLATVSPSHLEALLWATLAEPSFYYLLFCRMAYDALRICFVANRTLQSRRLRCQSCRERPLPGADGPLHVVVVPNFREPLPLLRALLESLRCQTIPAERIIVVLAMEARDLEREHTFQVLCSEYSAMFPRGFWCTVHTLRPWEVPGTGSNVACAMRALYRRLVGGRPDWSDGRVLVADRPLGVGDPDAGAPEEHGSDFSPPDFGPERGVPENLGLSEDPWKVLVTKCDADHIFAPEYLEEIEAEFLRQLDGRRYVYSGRLLEYHCAEECHPLVQADHAHSSQSHVFSPGMDFSAPVSTLTVTLGMCAEHGFWGPADLVSEDVLQSLKASFVSGWQATRRTWSPCVTQSPCTVLGRYHQHRRWHRGSLSHVAMAWLVYLDGRMDLRSAWYLARPETLTFEGKICPTALVQLALSPQLMRLFFELAPGTRHVLVAAAAAAYSYDTLRVAAQEAVLWGIALQDVGEVRGLPPAGHARRILTQQLLQPAARLLFRTLSTWHAAVDLFLEGDPVQVPFFNPPRSGAGPLGKERSDDIGL